MITLVSPHVRHENSFKAAFSELGTEPDKLAWIYLGEVAHSDYFKMSFTEYVETTILRHIEYLKALEARGALVMCGPFTDYPGGMVVVKAADIAAAKQIAEDDPFVKEGVRKFEVRSWLLATKENNYLA